MRRNVFALDQRYVAYRRADPPKDRCAHCARGADRPRTTGSIAAPPGARHRRSGGRWNPARRRCREELSPVENLRQAPAASAGCRVRATAHRMPPSTPIRNRAIACRAVTCHYAPFRTATSTKNIPARKAVRRGRGSGRGDRHPARRPRQQPAAYPRAREFWIGSRHAMHGPVPENDRRETAPAARSSADFDSTRRRVALPMSPAAHRTRTNLLPRATLRQCLTRHSRHF